MRIFTIVGITAILVGSPAMARNDFPADAVAAYPEIQGTRLESCSLCHSAIPALNGYGMDWEGENRNFATIEGLDSDGDGALNIDEILALTFPGDASDAPAPAEIDADIDGSGATNAVDVQLVINGALGIDIGGMPVDVNGDFAVDAVDVQLVINAVLQG